MQDTPNTPLPDSTAVAGAPAEQPALTLTKAEESSLMELFLRGVKILGMPKEITPETLLPILQAGRDASIAFGEEMLAGRTDRAKIGYQLLLTEIYIGASAKAHREGMMERIENIVGESRRRRIFQIDC
jgi:hypothetical protein